MNSLIQRILLDHRDYNPELNLREASGELTVWVAKQLVLFQLAAQVSNLTSTLAGQEFRQQLLGLCTTAVDKQIDPATLAAANEIIELVRTMDQVCSLDETTIGRVMTSPLGGGSIAREYWYPYVAYRKTVSATLALDDQDLLANIGANAIDDAACPFVSLGGETLQISADRRKFSVYQSDANPVFNRVVRSGTAFGYLACFDWSTASIDSILCYLTTLSVSREHRDFYTLLADLYFTKEESVDIVDFSDYLIEQRQIRAFTEFIELLRVRDSLVFDDPRIVAILMRVYQLGELRDKPLSEPAALPLTDYLCCLETGRAITRAALESLAGTPFALMPELKDIKPTESIRLPIIAKKTKGDTDEGIVEDDLDSPDPNLGDEEEEPSFDDEPDIDGDTTGEDPEVDDTDTGNEDTTAADDLTDPTDDTAPEDTTSAEEPPVEDGPSYIVISGVKLEIDKSPGNFKDEMIREKLRKGLDAVLERRGDLTPQEEQFIYRLRFHWFNRITIASILKLLDKVFAGKKRLFKPAHK